jgi:dimethylargininase
VLTAITRAVSPAIINCELSFIPRQPIDLQIAREQHHSYEQLLEKLGTRVVSLASEPDLPDSMFVEDPAIVLDELAVIFPLGTESRRREAASLAPAILRAATFSASAANFSSVSRNAATPKAFANSPPSSRRTTTKSSPFR